MTKLNPALNKYTGLPDPGFFSLSTKTGKSWNERFYGTHETEQANSFIEENKMKNCYSSIATFTTPQRNKQFISRPLELFADIDSHIFGEIITREGVKEFIKELKPFYNKIIPEPSYIVFSGRGFQIHYELEKNCVIEVPKWVRTEQALSDTLDQLITKVNHELSPYLQADFSLDKQVRDETRVLRVPETYNSEAGRFSSVIYNSGKKYTLEQILTEYGETMFYTEKEGRKTVKHNLKDLSGISEADILTATAKQLYKSKTKGYTIETLSRARLKDLEALIYLRNEKGELEGYREQLLRIAVEILLNITTNANDIRTYLEWLNQQFKKPLDGTKITYFVQYKSSTAQHRFSTGKIIEWLNIKESEQEKMKTLLNRKLVNKRFHLAHGSERNKKKRKAYAEKIGNQHRKEREARKREARAMKALGMKVDSIAAALKISRRTVFYYLKQK